MKKNISLLTIITIILLVSTGCKKKEEETKPKNSFSYEGNTNEFWYDLEKNRFADLECMYFAPNGGIASKKVPGISLLFYDRNIAILLDMYGESAGTYTGASAMCNDNVFKNNSMVYSKDGLRTEFISALSELVITKKSNSEISGNFKIRIGSNQKIIKDSIITGSFENIPLRDKL